MANAFLVAVFIILMVKEVLSTFPSIPKAGLKTDELLSSTTDVINDLLEESQGPECSVILVTDGTSVQPTVMKVMSKMLASHGTGFVAPSTGIDANFTRFEIFLALKGLRKLRLVSKCLTIVLVSSDSDFLGLFADIAKTVRLLVWSTRVIVVSELSYLEYKELFGRYQSFTKMNVMGVTVRDVDGDMWCDVYSYLPYGPKGPYLRRIAYWTSYEKLFILEDAQLFPEKYNNFHGSNEWVTSIMVTPYLIKKIVKKKKTAFEGDDGDDAEEEEEVAQYSGREHLLLQAVAQRLNISFSLRQVNKVGEMPRDVRSGAFAGVMRVAMLPQFLKMVEFSSFVEETTYTFCMATPTLQPQWQGIYQPLTNTVWAYVSLFLLVMPFLLKMVTTKTDTEPKKLRDSPGRPIVLKTFGMFLGQDALAGLPGTDSTRLLLVAWLIFGFVVGTAYRSNLTAFLTIPKYPKRIETLKELALSDARATFRPNNTAFYNFFRESDLFSFNAVYQRSDLAQSVTGGLTQALESKTAYFQERLNLDLQIARRYPTYEERSRLYIARENVIPGFAAWMVPQDAPYKEQVNEVIMAANEAGLIKKWMEVVLRIEKGELFLEYQRKRENGGNKENESKKENGTEIEDGGLKKDGEVALSVVHLQGPLLLIPFGLGFAVLTFAIEVVLHQFYQKYNIH